MKVTVIPIKPPEDFKGVTCTPEELAAVFAKFSRSNLGLEKICEMLDPKNSAKSIERIFKNLDYGHKSINDMTLVAIGIERVSMLAALFCFNICQTGAGQENSSRYINLKENQILSPNYLPEYLRDSYSEFIDSSKEAYTNSYSLWEGLIPSDLINAPESKEKQRLINNFTCDRARYFLPMASLTDFGIIQGASEWQRLIRELLSSNLKEFNELGNMLKDELVKVAPHTIKYCKPSEVSKKAQEFLIEKDARFDLTSITGASFFGHPSVTKGFNDQVIRPYIIQDLKNRKEASSNIDANRYETFSQISKFPVTYSIEYCSLAELRDLQRHRPGVRFYNRIPTGFYCAQDQISDDKGKLNYLYETVTNPLKGLYYSKGNSLFKDNNIEYLYSLGTSVHYTHHTTWDQLIYIAEIRTSSGAHFRYKKMLKDVLDYIPKEVREYINEG